MKTEEMVWDPKAVYDLRPVVSHNEPITHVSSYKYLGVHIDSTLSWRVHVEGLCSRCQRRLYFLRRLRAYGVEQRFMLLLYHAVLERIIRYGINAWQRWEVVEYKYFVTVLSTFFWYQYFTPLLIFLTTFYFYFLHFYHKYLYFLLHTFSKQVCYFSFNLRLVA